MSVAVFQKATGALVHVTTEALAPAANDATLGSVTVPVGYADDLWRWDVTTRTFVEDLAKVKVDLLTAVKAESERRTMLVYTPNRGKMREYSKKAQEVIDFRALASEGALTSVLNLAFAALPAAAKSRKFTYAQADAAKRGEVNIAAAIARFEAGMNNEVSVANLKATESAACDAIRGATTIAAARAAYAGINWNWSMT